MRLYTFSILFCLIFFSLAHAQCPTSNRPGIHVVQANENLYRISKLYNVSLENLCKWNNIKIDQMLPVCKELAVAENVEIPKSFEVPVTTGPATTAAPVPSFPVYQRQAGTRHVVQPGETLAGLAELYGYTERRFREFNAIWSGEAVTPGSILLSTDCPCGRISYSTSPQFGTAEIPATGPSNPPSAASTTGAATSAPINEKPAMGPIDNTTPVTGPRTSSAYGSMRPDEINMVDEINLVRSDPRGYVKFVREYADNQKRTNGFKISDETVNELVRELNRMEPLSFLEPSECLYTAAKKHGQDLLRMGKSDHQGSDGSWPWDRVLRECPGFTDGNENLVGGPSSVREAVMILLIDDDIPTRGHRRTILNPQWKYIACYKIGTVGMMPNSWVQVFGY